MNVNPPLGLSQYSLSTSQGQRALIDWLQQNWERTGAGEDYIAGSRDGIVLLNEGQAQQDARLDQLDIDVAGNTQSIEANTQTNTLQSQAIDLNAQAIESANLALTTLNSTINQLQNELTELASQVDEANNGFGFIDYNDSSTALSPITLTPGVWTDISNDGLGAFTNKTYKPAGISELLDSSNGYLDFSDLPLGSEVLVRNDFAVTPATNNCLLEARYLLGSGAGEYPLQFWSERLDSGSGIPYQRVTSFPIYMGDTNTQQNPGKMQLRLSTPGTVVNAGVYISIRVASS